MATQRDYYDILGVPRGAEDDDIKRAFRKQAQQWHPDVNTSAEADVRFKEINEAYQVLSDPQRRQAYDMFGHAAAVVPAAPASIRLGRVVSVARVARVADSRAVSRGSATCSTRYSAVPPRPGAGRACRPVQTCATTCG